MGHEGQGMGSCHDSWSVSLSSASDALPMDTNVVKLSFSVQICVAVLTMAIARTIKMTFIRTKTKRNRTSPMSQNLSEDARNCDHVKNCK